MYNAPLLRIPFPLQVFSSFLTSENTHVEAQALQKLAVGNKITVNILVLQTNTLKETKFVILIPNLSQETALSSSQASCAAQ